MGRGSSLVYGKISLASDGESMDKLIGYLQKILTSCGYPEKKKDEAEEEGEVSTVDDLKKLVKDSRPARDSINSINEEEEDAEVEDFHPDDEP